MPAALTRVAVAAAAAAAACVGYGVLVERDWYRLRREGIEIPFPQRDITLRGGLETLKSERRTLN